MPTASPRVLRLEPLVSASGSLLRRWVRISRALSLDVVLGALAGGAFASHATRADPTVAWWFVLAATTWVVYSCDRLLDARRIRGAASSFRHRYFQRNHGTLTLHTAAAGVVASAAAVAFLPRETVIAGAILAATVGLYLIGAQQPHRFPRFPKELLAAAIYVAGIWILPMQSGSFDPWSPALALTHFAAAFVNLVQFGLFELESDRRDGHGSLARRRGARAAQRLVSWVTGVTLVGIVTLVPFAPPPVRAGLLAAAPVVATPWLMQRFARFFGERDRYRIAGDLVFLLLALPWIGRQLGSGG